jgi:hypothetical protein
VDILAVQLGVQSGFSQLIGSPEAATAAAIAIGEFEWKERRFGAGGDIFVCARSERTKGSSIKIALVAPSSYGFTRLSASSNAA